MVPKSGAEDLQPIVEQLEDDLRKLTALLKALSSESVTPGPAQPGQGQEDTKPSITPMEAEEFILKVEKIHGDADTTERLTNLEGQIRRLNLLGAVILAVMLASIAVIFYLVTHPTFFDKVP